MAKNATLIKKITAKVMMGEVDKSLIPESENSIDLFHAYGIATSVKTGSTNFGEWTALIGQFRAVRLDNGDVFESGKMLLPDIARDAIVGRLGATADTKGIEFAFTIGIKRDTAKNSARGYVYTAKPMIEITEADPIAKLEAKALPGGLPKIGSAKK